MGTVTTRKGEFDASVTLTMPDEEKNPMQTSIIRGNYFTEDNVLNADSVCVIDKASALYLFGTPDVIGMELEATIEGVLQTIQIVGVRDSDEELMKANDEAMKMFGMEMPVFLEMPYTTAENWGSQIEDFFQPDNLFKMVETRQMQLQNLLFRHCLQGIWERARSSLSNSRR